MLQVEGRRGAAFVVLAVYPDDDRRLAERDARTHDASGIYRGVRIIDTITGAILYEQGRWHSNDIIPRS